MSVWLISTGDFQTGVVTFIYINIFYRNKFPKQYHVLNTAFRFVKPVTFIYINIFQGNNFPKQYHVLKTVSRLFDSYAKIANIFYKLSHDRQNFQVFT